MACIVVNDRDGRITRLLYYLEYWWDKSLRGNFDLTFPDGGAYLANGNIVAVYMAGTLALSARVSVNAGEPADGVPYPVNTTLSWLKTYKL